MNYKQVIKFTIPLITILLMSCEGDQGTEGENGMDGLISIINTSNEPQGLNCDTGGIRLDSGIDENVNGTLESNEIQNTSYICNGSNGVSDEQVRFRFDFGGNTTSTTPIIGGSLINFDKNFFVEVDSIVFAADPYVGDISNTSFVELYDRTNEEPIANSLLSSNNLPEDAQFLYSENIINQLPDGEITLGIRFWSETQGQFAATDLNSIFLLLYRSN
ncbi:hypothetical protein [Cellulophaga sp. HaHa_2_1]|uniref:DUF7151 family protein n=1 Tax=Cellulophaga sp. HaHa_2_1 TaxID=2749994 RepID=UPI001C4FF72D|nr:hypothetical protein [Cellulophaga sp. HaHa_2_1]QXP53591.1 hypothetical protein H0I24_06575 [Cellulophaga sp. HaHa_2_1]